MARGERRSLVSLLPGPLGEEWLTRLAEECQGAAAALEKAAARRSPWFALPFSLREADLERLGELAAEVVANSDVLLVLGSADLERGARAVTEAVAPARRQRRVPMEFVASTWAGAGRLPQLLEGLGERRVGLLLLGDDSADPGQVVCLRLLWRHLMRRHGSAETRRRILVATTAQQGPLQEMAEAEGLRLLSPPTAVPRRYSTFTPAALLPAAAAGVDPARLVEGARSQARSMEGQEASECPSLQYALLRLLLAEAGHALEILATADPALEGVAREGERLLAFPGRATRQAPLCLAQRLPEALYTRQPWLEDGMAAGFATLLTAEAAPGAAEAEVGEGPTLGWPGVEALTPSALVGRSTEGAAAVLRQAGLPCLEVRVPRLDGFHVGALLFFLQSVRGLTVVLHAPDADRKKVSGYETWFVEAAGPDEPGTEAAEPAAAGS